MENICIIYLFAVKMFRKGKKLTHNSSNDDSFEDAMNDTPSTHLDIFDLLSESSDQDNTTVDSPKDMAGMKSEEEPETAPEKGAATEEETSEAEKPTSSAQSSSDNTSTTIAKSNLTFFIDGLGGVQNSSSMAKGQILI